MHTETVADDSVGDRLSVLAHRSLQTADRGFPLLRPATTAPWSLERRSSMILDKPMNRFAVNAVPLIERFKNGSTLLWEFIADR
ncbi:hypothetical protein E4U13_005175 [Claviceps humidiphila]|uniref:Uncharacterized protein n=1 Tax=Claviceps humidiphila TaxID=1294629 RepID=A0A9P7TVB8_9HYPO|nr:hypothetical protein E4U13_005175 [Claviceps humidiphila]